MDERSFRRVAATDNRRQTQDGRLRTRPDRVALWAVAMAFVAMIAAAASAQAGDGGVGDGGVGDGTETTAKGTCTKIEFGSRTLAPGDCGSDVKTLNWLLNSKPLRDLDAGVGLDDDFASGTEETVRSFEQTAGLPVDGVVDKQTRDSLVRGTMRKQVATWYGPGLFGNGMACGKKLKHGTVGVAHKTLPCGSRVVLKYEGSWLRTRVKDRGPYAHGAKWDLTQKAARKLGFEETDKLRVAKIPKTSAGKRKR